MKTKILTNSLVVQGITVIFQHERGISVSSFYSYGAEKLSDQAAIAHAFGLWAKDDKNPPLALLGSPIVSRTPTMAVVSVGLGDHRMDVSTKPDHEDRFVKDSGAIIYSVAQEFDVAEG